MKRGDTVYSDTVAQVLGRLSPTLLQKFDDCVKVALGLPQACFPLSMAAA